MIDPEFSLRSEPDLDQTETTDDAPEIQSGDGWPPIDPNEVGPLDLLGRAIDRITELFWWLLGATIVLSIIFGYGQSAGWWSWPSLPVWGWVIISAAGGGALLGAYPVYRSLRWFHSPDSHYLVEVDPVDGSMVPWELSEDRFSNLTVVGQDGEERASGTAYLHQIQIGRGDDATVGYEIDRYHPEQNVAVSSWMAGATNAEIRRHRKAVDVIKQQLSQEATRSLDEIIETPEAVRQQGKEAINEMVRVAEGERSPGQASVSESISEIVAEQQESSDELIEDRGIEDIEERIEQIKSNGSSEAES